MGEVAKNCRRAHSPFHISFLHAQNWSSVDVIKGDDSVDSLSLGYWKSSSAYTGIRKGESLMLSQKG